MRPCTIFNIAIAVLSVIMILAGAVTLSSTDTGYWILYSGLLLAAIFPWRNLRGLPIDRSSHWRPTVSAVSIQFLFQEPLINQ
jgi:hypothetical protein